MKINIKHCIFLVILLNILLTSCYECCNGEDYQFRIRLEIIVTKNDTFQIYYLTKNQKEFVEKLSVKVPIKGNIKEQFIEFCLPAEPTDLRIDFSKNTINNELKIQSALFENQDNQTFILGNMFHLYFRGNEYVKYNNEASSYDFQQIPNKTYKPSIIARKIMKHRLENRLKF